LHHLPETIVKEFGFKQKRDITGDEDEIAEPAYYSREMVEKYFRAVFAHARKHGLPVTSIDKANMMSRYDFWRKIATRIGREFPDVPLTHLLVDSANALLFTPANCTATSLAATSTETFSRTAPPPRSGAWA